MTSRILRRHPVPLLCTLESLSCEVIRSLKATALRHERDQTGKLVHTDVQ